MEDGRELFFTYDAIMNYHGGSMPAGVALAYRMFQHLIAEYIKAFGNPPERATATFFSGLGENGQGILDTADALLRIRKYNSLLPAEDLSVIDAPEAPGGGKYYFKGCFDRMQWTAALHPGLISQEFFNRSREAHALRSNGQILTSIQSEQLYALRKQTELALLSHTSRELFQFECSHT